MGRKIADVDLPGLPHLGSGITWEYQGRPVLATPNLKEPVVTVIDMKDWKIVKRIPTLGPGFFMRSHENTPYAWVDVFSGPDKDAMQIIDKRTLEIVKIFGPSRARPRPISNSRATATTRWCPSGRWTGPSWYTMRRLFRR